MLIVAPICSKRPKIERVGCMNFVVTTTVLNGARYIDEAILSVVTQPGPFRVRYHVQDGGSSDATLAKLAAWSND